MQSIDKRCKVCHINDALYLQNYANPITKQFCEVKWKWCKPKFPDRKLALFQITTDAKTYK